LLMVSRNRSETKRLKRPLVTSRISSMTVKSSTSMP
jgi:hypothetical protein